MNEAEVYFKLVGDDFNPDEITEFLGIKPTRAHRKGEPGRYNPKLNFSSWELSTGKIEDEVVDIYDMSSSLIANMESKTDKIVKLIEKLNLEAVLQVVLWITMDDSKSTPAIGFDKSTISFLNAVNASIDVDTYRNQS